MALSFLRLLQLQDITGEDGDFGVYVEFFIDQGVAYLRFGGILVAGRFVVVGHRDDVVRVTRVDLMGFLVVGARLYRVVLFQVKVTQNDLVAGFHRIFDSQLFYFVESGIRLFQLVVELVFLHGERLVHADGRFEGVVGIDSLAGFAFLCQCFCQVIVQFRFSGKGFYQFLIFLGCFSVHTQVAADSSQWHPGGEVVRTIGYGTLQHLDRLFRPVHLHIER